MFFDTTTHIKATALHLATLSSQILARFLRRMRTPVWLGAERTWLAGSLAEKAKKALAQTPKAIDIGIDADIDMDMDIDTYMWI